MSILVYGANGYTAGLIVRLAVERGQRPILAGRSAHAISDLACPFGLEVRAFGLGDPGAVDRGLSGVKVVLHCAGPFAHTSRPMVDGCLRARVPYLDLTGEVVVFEACAARDAEARAAGVMVMPGVGFDVVPSDCLAAHLKRRLPSATELALGILGLTRVSRGTAITMLENVHRGGLVRRNGLLTPVPNAHATRMIDFGRGPQTAVTMPWGDVSTAYHSTRIPDITVFMVLPPVIRMGIKLSSVLAPVLKTAAVQRALKRLVQAGRSGPTDEERARGSSILWGEVVDPAGRRAVSRLSTPEAYTLTALAALEIAGRVLRGDAPAGYQTPSSAYGPDLILATPGCHRTDEPIPKPG